MKPEQTIRLLIITNILAVVLLLAFAFGPYSPPLFAANPAPPDVKACEVVNTFEAISIARCTPENGAPYLVNSLGFMIVEPQ